ncbi:drebrin-like protein [Pollicipes pollicipes]|uniref:drebrin-like protein n=1 Tax=Pollicipes pollicipes TaxID=41117 RepID=UPI00188555BE|nr:drebrin-like protein [Pollicipes pollicipes]
MDPKTSLPKYVLINWARDEDEVDEEAILEKLARAGSSVYNFRQRSTETSPQTKPVGSNYRRIVPAAEIDLSARDRWTRPGRASTRALERSRSINEARQAERKAERVLSQSDQEAARWQEHREQDRLDEEERKHRADRLRMERKQEAQQLIGHRTGAARAVFESHTAAGQLTSPTSPVGGASGGVAFMERPQKDTKHNT